MDDLDDENDCHVGLKGQGRTVDVEEKRNDRSCLCGAMKFVGCTQELCTDSSFVLHTIFAVDLALALSALCSAASASCSNALMCTLQL